jgi:hypothetical protein
VTSPPVDDGPPVHVHGPVLVATHWPFEHVVPVPHVLHVVPPVPQVVMPGVVWQRPVESQQPLGQDVGLQTQAPAEHVVPVAHVLHIVPPVPQVIMPGVVWQWPLESQQPLGQEVGLQTQLPFEQVVPVPQTTHAMPLIPQLELPEGWQLLEESRHEVALQPHIPCALHT